MIPPQGHFENVVLPLALGRTHCATQRSYTTIVGPVQRGLQLQRHCGWRNVKPWFAELMQFNRLNRRSLRESRAYRQRHGRRQVTFSGGR